MVRVDRTEIFAKWLRKLRDLQARVRILNHIDNMEEGKMGNAKSVGGGVYEKKIDYGPGYRLYYFQKGKDWILLLCGGDKSTQQDDINQAKELKREIE
ncbi:type II toxin-antitoxin system RelE/ParE family toxin [Candidatus Saccharibacteria bacterium]|nr:type II toxin-antitoxin system RelE/ParE family toxin [Candidatus Saccharibacteria bacterium]